MIQNELQKQILAMPPLREVLDIYGIETKKSLGQNFIFDLNLTDKIARTAGKIDGEHVLEIGPGPGGLTRAILYNNAEKVTVIERDRRVIPILQELKNITGDRLSIIEDDALEFDESKIANGRKIKVIANLPYNIATELLFKWLNNINLFSSMTLMFQKEVADRIMAAPGNKAYGRLSIIAQWLCNVRHEFDINPAAFFPPPKVTSSLITLIPRPKPLAEADKNILEMICKAAFGQRRKTISNSLKQISDNPMELLSKAGIDPKTRPEDMSISDFCALAQSYKS